MFYIDRCPVFLYDPVSLANQQEINDVPTHHAPKVDEVVTGEGNDGNAWAIGYVQLPTCKISFSILEGFSSNDYQLVAMV